MNFAERLIKLRKERGFTQEQLANLAGISVMSVRRYESRNSSIRRTPSIDDCKRIASVLDMQLWQLIFGAEQYNGESCCDAQKRISELSDGEIEIIIAFRELNELGRKVATERLKELGEIQK